MAQIIPTTKEIADLVLAEIESKLNQTSPPQDVAFNRVLSRVFALLFTMLYKYGADRSMQNLALTASDLVELQKIGGEYDTPIKPAEAAVLKILLPADDGTVIPASVSFIGDLNQISYTPDASATATGGYAEITVQAAVAGTIGTLKLDDTLTMTRQIAGAGTSAFVGEVLFIGVDEESKEDYRQRILDVIRAKPGGGNAVDYKLWAQAVAGVSEAFVYAGRPFDVIETSYPGDRTVYVKADETIDPDGIAPQGLLDDVRQALNIDPVTFESRPPLGLVDDTLYVQSIRRTEFYVEIWQPVIPVEIETQVKADIEAAVSDYFWTLRPFNEGIDFPSERNDVITALSLSEIVQRILRGAGASAEDVFFGTTPSSFVPTKTLEPDELAKLGGIEYVS